MPCSRTAGRQLMQGNCAGEPLMGALNEGRRQKAEGRSAKRERGIPTARNRSAKEDFDTSPRPNDSLAPARSA